MKAYLILLALIFLITSCSTLPKHAKPDNIVFNKGMNFYNQAYQFEKSGNISNALWYYTLALESFEQMDYQQEIVYSLFGIIRSSYILQDYDLYKKQRQVLETFYLSQNTRFSDEYKLLQAEIFLHEKDYSEIIKLLAQETFRSDVNELSRLTYLSLAEQHLDIHKSFNNLNKQIKITEKEYRKGRFANPSVLSYAYYVSGLIYNHTGLINNAMESFRKSSEIDRHNNYRYGLSLNLFQIALLLFNDNQLNDARSYFYRSNKIFRHLGYEYYIDLCNTYLLITEHKINPESTTIQDLINFSNQVKFSEIQEILNPYINN